MLSATYFFLYMAVPCLGYAAASLFAWYAGTGRLGTGASLFGTFTSIFVLSLLFDAVALVYLGRQYRKHFAHRFLQHWPFCCIGLLILANALCLTRAAAATGLGDLLNHSLFLELPFVLCLVLPGVLMQLPLAWKLGRETGGIFSIGGVLFVCFLLGVLSCIPTALLYLLGNEEENVKNLESLSCSLPTNSLYFWALALCLFTAILAHGYFLGKLTNKTFPRVFAPQIRILIAVSVCLFLASHICVFVLQHSLAKQLQRLEQHFAHQITASELTSFYLGHQKAEPDFWEQLYQNVSKIPAFSQTVFVGTKPPQYPEQWAELRQFYKEQEPQCRKIDEQIENVPVIPKANKMFWSEDGDFHLNMYELMAHGLLARFYCGRVLACLKEQRLDEAFRCFRLHRKLVRSIDTGVFPLDALWAVQIETNYGRTMLAALLPVLGQKELETLLEDAADAEKRTELLYRRCLYGECVFHHLAFQKMRHDTGLPGKKRAPSIASFRFLCPQYFCLSLKQEYDVMALFEVGDSFEALEQHLACHPQSGLVRHGAANSLQMIRRLATRLRYARALDRLEHTAIAIALYQKRTGNFPRALAALFPELLPVIPLDPATNAELNYSADDYQATLKAGEELSITILKTP